MVSVIIPAYNRVDLLEIAICSVIKQEIKFEIIIIDDFSDDNKIENLANKYSCSYYKNSKSFGAQASRNKGVSVAKYEYIAFLDSDDIWNGTTKLSRQVDVLKSNSNVSLVYTSIQKIDINGAYLSSDVYSDSGYVNSFLKKILHKDTVGTFSTVLIRKKDFIDVGMCDDVLPARQDWDLWIRLSTIGNAFRVVSELVEYRVHSNQISSSTNNKLTGYSLLLEKHQSKFAQFKLAYLKNVFKLFLLSHITKTTIKNKRVLKIVSPVFISMIDFSTLLISKIYLNRSINFLIPSKVKNSYLLKGLSIHK